MTGAAGVQVIDLHSHYTHPRHPPVPPPGVPAAAARQLLANTAQFTDQDLQLELMDARGIGIRVLSAPPSLFHPAGPPPDAALKATNDHLASRVAARPDRFAGFASIDAYAGDRAAAEVARAVTDLELSGIVVDSTNGTEFIGSPRTVPALEAAAAFGVPVFVHPTSSQAAAAVSELGRYGVILDRGFNNAASLLSVLHHDITGRFPRLPLLFAMLGVSGVAAAQLLGAGDQLTAGARDADGRAIGGFYIDTMTFAPRAVRFAVDALGTDRVVIGSDWPPTQDKDATPDRVTALFGELGLSAADRELIAAGNARRVVPRLPPGHPVPRSASAA